MKGAGGTSGGVGQFVIGVVMMCGGCYLLLNSIRVTSHFGLGMRLYGFNAFGGSYGITSGMVLIPFMIGIGMVFYNARNIIGWLLSSLSIVALVFGVISSINFRMRTMSAFDLIVMLVLSVGGLGLLLNSLREFNRTHPEEKS